MIRPTRAHFRSYLLRTRKPATPCSTYHCVLANYLQTIHPQASLGIYTWRIGQRHIPLPVWANRVMQRFDTMSPSGYTREGERLPIPARQYRKRVLEVI